MSKPTVLIIGAGAAGLMAAKELADHFDVTVLEARDRIGGRIHNVENNASLLVEAGAEFIHGDLPITLSLLKEAGIEYHKVEGKVYRKTGDQLEEQKEFIEHWDVLLKKMKSLPNDMIMADFLLTYFPGDKYQKLRLHAKAFAEGFDIADIQQASTKALYKEWEVAADEENYRIAGGYGALIEFLQDQCLQKNCRIITGQVVKQVDWEHGQVTVYTSETHRYFAEKLIITVPLGMILKTAAPASLNFAPPIDEHLSHTREIGFGAVIKVILQFDKRLWKQDAGFILSDEVFPTWWTQLPDTKPVITGWVGGPNAERLSNESDEVLLAIAVKSFSNIIGIPELEVKSHLENSFVFNWQNDEYALGAYSYSRPSTEMARTALQIPVEDTIYFAGEAFGEDSNGTVEAALSSGKKVAAEVTNRRLATSR
jgi:monoamine oxidase